MLGALDGWLRARRNGVVDRAPSDRLAGTMIKAGVRVGLGKTNYCLQALVRKGWVKADKFKNSRNNIAYAYLLTPEGLARKAKMTVRFLKRQTAEFEAI